MDADDHAHRELRRLAKAQQKLLAQSAPAIPGYEAALIYRPAYVVTGDYYDFFPFANDAWGVFIGDGSGHGPAACMVMAMMRTILRTHPDIHREPGTTLELAGAMLRELIPSDLFMTGLYLRLEQSGRAQWAAAGHHPPIRMTPDGSIPPSDLDVGDVPLGLHADHVIHYETISWGLVPGERLLLFTDGLYEAQNRDNVKFGRGPLERCLRESRGRPLSSLTECLRQRAEEHLAGAEFEDDFTVIGIERLAAA
jgi:sigma-B regulation protein RsbU (phosphoserine phosphatase)